MPITSNLSGGKQPFSENFLYFVYQFKIFKHTGGVWCMLALADGSVHATYFITKE